jgi:myosin heavy subunit
LFVFLFKFYFQFRYAILTKQTWPKWNGKVTDGVMHIVDSMHLDRREVQLGNTKVFIKSPESVSENLSIGISMYAKNLVTFTRRYAFTKI